MRVQSVCSSWAFLTLTLLQRSNDPKDETIVWTCSSDRYKAAERKTHQTVAAMQKVEDSITPQQRTTALRSANQKRRHDMRAYNVYSLCSRSRLLAVSMLGYALRVDRHIIVACCSCLGYTRVVNAHWYALRLSAFVPFFTSNLNV